MGFEEGLRIAIRVPVTTSTNWSNFSCMVEAAMRVENTLSEERKSFKEMNKIKECEEGLSKKAKYFRKHNVCFSFGQRGHIQRLMLAMSLQK